MAKQRQWADHYGPEWYKHKDGTPPRDDDETYVWRHGQWVNVRLYEDEDELDF